MLDLLGAPVDLLGWVDLYKIYEIIRANVGGNHGLAAKNWIPSSQLDAFTASANRPDVSGTAARHARMPGAPPKRTIDLPEARQLIGRLVVCWLDSM